MKYLGKITDNKDLVTKEYVDNAVSGSVSGVKGNAESSYRTGQVNLTPANIGAAASSHAHGNITSGGDITTTATIASGDRLVINDESASKVTNSSITFGTDTTKYLRNDGTWATPAGTYSLPVASNGTRGGVQIGFTTNATNRNYAVALSSEKMYVNVPWTDTTYNAGTGLELSSTTFNNYRGIEYIRGTWTAASGTWTGVSTDSELYDGKQIILYMPFAGSGNATLNLTLSDGTTTGAKDVYYESTSRFTTHKGQNSQIHLIYHKALKLSNNTTYEGWWYIANRDTTDITKLGTPYTRAKAKEVLYRYQLLFTIDEEYLVPASNGNNNTGTDKTITTQQFDPFGQIYYYGSANTINAGSLIADWNYCYSSYGSGVIDLRYSFNTGTTLTGSKAIYLVCVPQNNGKVVLHTTPISQTLPTTQDGLIYKYIGQAYDTYRFVLREHKPCYVYRNGGVQEYVRDAETVSGYTVGINVPSNAVFTDTKVTQAAPITTNATYPLLLGYNNTSTTTAYTNTVNRTGTGITVNPSTNTISATAFSGNATSASKITDLTSTDSASSTDTWRKVWISYNDNVTGRPAVSTALTFQTSTGTLKATTFSGALSGNASTATKLANAKTIQTNLASTSSASFDGSANITPGVTGTLAIGNGGTGLTASPSMLTNLGSTTAANVLQASPRPGVTGTLGAGNGGTGQTSLINAANALLNALTTGSSTPVDNDYYISQYVRGGTTTTTYHRRPMSALWSYISNKISSSGKYVTVDTEQTLTSAAKKTYIGLQTYGSSGIDFGTTGTNNTVTPEVNMKYDETLDALVFSFPS